MPWYTVKFKIKVEADEKQQATPRALQALAEKYLQGSPMRLKDKVEEGLIRSSDAQYEVEED